MLKHRPIFAEKLIIIASIHVYKTLKYQQQENVCVIPAILSHSVNVAKQHVSPLRDIVIILNGAEWIPLHVSAYFNRCNNVNYARNCCMFCIANGYGVSLICTCYSSQFYTRQQRDQYHDDDFATLVIGDKSDRIGIFAYGECNQVHCLCKNKNSLKCMSNNFLLFALWNFDFSYSG